MKNSKALIVDANKASCKNLLSVIKNGIEIKVTKACETPLQALTYINDNKDIDLIFLDYESIADGLEDFIRASKKMLIKDEVKYILLANSASKSFLVKAASLGIASFILKPYIFKTVVDKVKTVCASKKQRESKRLTLLESIDIEYVFNKQNIPGVMIDISSGGCLIKSQPLGEFGLDIFEKLLIKIPFGNESVEIPSQLIRMERYIIDGDNKISAAFVYEDMDQEITMQFAKLWAFLLGNNSK